MEDAQETFDASVLAIETESRDLLTSIDANIELLTGGQLLGVTPPRPDLNAQAIGAAPSTASLLPAATAPQPAGREVSPLGVGNGGFGGQNIRITLVGDFGDGFAQKLGETLVRLRAEGRILGGILE